MTSFFRTIKISKKVPMAVIAMIAIPILLSVIFIRASSGINDGGKEIYDNYFVSVVNLTDARKYTYEEFVWLKSHIISPDDQSMREAERQIADADKKLKESINKFALTLDAGEETRIFNEFKKKTRELAKIREDIIRLSQTNNDDEADQIANTAYRDLFFEIQEQIEGMFATNVVGAEEYYNSNQKTYESTTFYMVVLLVLSVAIVVFFGWILIVTIQQPLVSASSKIQQINRNNDLKQKLEVKGNDEITDLSKVFNDMIKALAEVIMEITQSLIVLKGESKTLLRATHDSGEDLKASASMLSDVQNSTIEITHSIGDIAKSAVQASKDAGECVKESQKGRSIQQSTIGSVDSLKSNMHGASEAISGLASDSDAIGSVLDVIRGIAEQTNLLALNAAIEAARAGEQGRGFAVVADEVRTLAQRTQESTSEIQQMIEKVQSGAHSTVEAMENSLKSLDETVELTHESAVALKSIESKIEGITMLNDQIACATEQQSIAVKEISNNVAQASDLSNKSSQTFNLLRESSNQLLSIVAHFEPLVRKFKI